MNRELRAIVEALEEQGFTWRTTRRGHLMVFKDGRPVTTFSGTASDHRSWRNALAQLRRAGFKWPRR